MIDIFQQDTLTGLVGLFFKGRHVFGHNWSKDEVDQVRLDRRAWLKRRIHLLRNLRAGIV